MQLNLVVSRDDKVEFGDLILDQFNGNLPKQITISTASLSKQGYLKIEELLDIFNELSEISVFQFDFIELGFDKNFFNYYFEVLLALSRTAKKVVIDFSDLEMK